MTEDSTNDATAGTGADMRNSRADITLPGDSSKMLRRRFLGAMGATGAAAFGALAGCIELGDDGGTTESGGVEYDDIDHFELDWVPNTILKSLDIQVAFNASEIFFRFTWKQEVKNGWFHDLFVYEDGEWVRYSNVNPGIAEEEREDHTGFTEDRLSFMIDDGSVKGFENFGGWLTVHEGTRTLPGAVSGEEVENHPHHGDILENSDVRKYIPQSRNGEWWENPWDDVKDQDELDEMLENGEYIDMPMCRCHRGLPAGYGTVQTILDHRHGAMDEPSRRIRDSQSLDDDGRPQYMFDPDLVENGALELDEIYEGNVLQTDTHALIHRDEDRDDDAWPPDVPDTTAEFDPDLAEFEGAAIPRRMLFPDEVEGPGALWKIDGKWEDGEWDVVMFREMQSGYLGEKDFQAGAVYDFAPAIHAGAAQRWHYVGYPYKLGLGEGTDADIRAVQFEGDRPDWNDVPEFTIPLIYPGQCDWTWLISPEHRGYIPTRNDEMSIWDVHENPRRMAAMLIGQEVGEDPRK